jgi:hypothetical protein
MVGFIMDAAGGLLDVDAIAAMLKGWAYSVDPSGLIPGLGINPWEGSERAAADLAPLGSFRGCRGRFMVDARRKDVLRALRSREQRRVGTRDRGVFLGFCVGARFSYAQFIGGGLFLHDRHGGDPASGIDPAGSRG